MRFRLIAAAMLFNGDDLLLMKRPANRTISPGLWAAVGGHVEPYELADPRAACLREIGEETGLKETDLFDFRLQYLLIRRYEDEIRQQFFFVARTARRDVSECDEGEFYWIPRTEVLDRPMSYIFRAALEHYFAHGPYDRLWLGSSGMDGPGEGTPRVFWSPLTDYGIL